LRLASFAAFYSGGHLRIPADADQHSWVIAITIPA
jgi:hypothetical protein